MCVADSLMWAEPTSVTATGIGGEQQFHAGSFGWEEKGGKTLLSD